MDDLTITLKLTSRIIAVVLFLASAGVRLFLKNNELATYLALLGGLAALISIAGG